MIIEVIEEVDLIGEVVERFERRKNGMEVVVVVDIEEAIVFEMVRKPKSESEVFLKFERKFRERFRVVRGVVGSVVRSVVKGVVNGVVKSVKKGVVKIVNKGVVKIVNKGVVKIVNKGVVKIVNNGVVKKSGVR
jgi:hypothetical protein